MDMLETLRVLNSCHGPSGGEAGIAQAIRGLSAPFSDEITTDPLGNLIVRKRGRGPKVMFAAHMDSIGCIVTHIDENGFLRFGPLGGLTPAEIAYAPVRFANGTRGVLAVSAQAEKAFKLDDLYIDIGAKNRAEAESKVQVGDTAVYDTPAYQAGDRLVSPYMDNRISCVVLLMALERLQQSENDLYFVFTVQEELGLRGARTAAFSIDPDYAVAVDVTSADDELDTKHQCSSVLGGGAAVKVMDRSVLCHPAIVEKLCALAQAEGIPFQRDVIRFGGTDAGAIHQSRGGVVTGGISIPCRYTHTPQEMVDARDVEACAALAAAYAGAELEG
ncbi:M42 family peptidase [Pseudoflavonifractor sp. 524-17]|uniref:M42 family metallopeptidase n=1 Tax=Pseudoflavonifractor sp. 524-17 TaxID=2304577 RepID=UPI00137B5687|nr:M42 family metallopeptidase [Pseudoflavonifractor sp. 524-17]NCE65226.1 M42 family peptidase [Pseudoflavonifractor sp. 524-17]